MQATSEVVPAAKKAASAPSKRKREDGDAEHNVFAHMTEKAKNPSAFMAKRKKAQQSQVRPDKGAQKQQQQPKKRVRPGNAKWKKSKPRKADEEGGDFDTDEDKEDEVSDDEFERAEKEAEDEGGEKEKINLFMPQSNNIDHVQSHIIPALKQYEVPDQFVTKRDDEDLNSRLRNKEEIKLWLFELDQKKIQLPSVEALVNRAFDNNEELDRNNEELYHQLRGHAQQRASKQARAKFGNMAVDAMKAKGVSNMCIPTMYCKSKGQDTVVVEALNKWPRLYAQVHPAMMKHVNSYAGLKEYKNLVERALAKKVENLIAGNVDENGQPRPSPFQKLQRPFIVNMEIVNHLKSMYKHDKENKTLNLFKIETIDPSLIPLLGDIMNMEGHCLDTVPEMRTVEGKLRVVQNPVIRNISTLDFRVVTSPRIGLVCSEIAFQKLRSRWVKSSSKVVKFLNKELKHHKIPLTMLGWNHFNDVDIDIVKDPHKLFIPGALDTGHDVSELPSTFHTEDPVLRRDIENLKAVVFRIPDAMKKRLDDLDWEDTELEKLIAMQVLGKELMLEKKVTSLYRNEFFVAAVSRSCRQAFSTTKSSPVVRVQCHLNIFERDVLFTLRHLLDRGLRGCAWLKIPEGKYEVEKSSDGMTIVRVLEENIQYDKVLSETAGNNAKLRVLSLDIECVGQKGSFPKAKNDPVCSIGCHFSVSGGGKDRGKSWTGCVGTSTKSPDFYMECFPFEETTKQSLGARLEVVKKQWEGVVKMLKMKLAADRVGAGLQHVKELEKLMINVLSHCNFDTDKSDEMHKLLNVIADDVELLYKRNNGNTEDMNSVINVMMGWHRNFMRLDMLGKNELNRGMAERKLLNAFACVVNAYDPDIITGWNIAGFDFKYLFQRALVLEVHEMFMLGRMHQAASMREAVYQSRAVGQQERFKVTIPGRLVLDAYMLFRSDHKMTSYKLENVARTFLKITKMGVHHSEIAKLANGTPEERKKLVSYMERDCILPPMLLEKKQKIAQICHLAQICGETMRTILDNGQSRRVKSILLRAAKEHDLVMPYFSSRKSRSDPTAEDMEDLICPEDKGDPDTKHTNRNQFMGATVLPPKVGFYRRPVSTLDFNSLYPSIQRAKNIDYKTIVFLKDFGKYSEDEIEKHDAGKGQVVAFVKEAIYKGLIPKIQTTYTEDRSKVKKELAAVEKQILEYELLNKDQITPEIKAKLRDLEVLQANLDAKQLAIKVCSNSVYGYPTGYDFREVFLSAVVTKIGRENILMAKDVVEATFCKANGYPADCKVVYGDTDSIIILWGIDDIGKCIMYSKAAEWILAELLPKPMYMEFEKIYDRYLLLRRKRYGCAKLDLKKFFATGEIETEVKASGLETVRRDNCKYVRDTVAECVRILMKNKESREKGSLKKQVIDYIEERSIKLMNGEVDMSEVVFSATRATLHYTNPTPVSVVAAKMKERDAESEPRVGDRVDYTFFQGRPTDKAKDLVDDPMWILENRYPIDYMRIYERKFKTVMRKFLCPLFVGKDQLIPEDKAEFNKAMEAIQKIVQTKIFDKLERERISHVMIHDLEKGESTKGKVVHQKMADNNFMNKYLVHSNRCINCRAPLTSSGALVCGECQGEKFACTYIDMMDKLRERELVAAQSWANCQRCAETLMGQVKCNNRDCPLFYRRVTAKRDAEDLRYQISTMQQSESLSW